jgi:prolyl-tRNA editing enzyme YbaK/EbsC (Cys-tRNA(Pro) deacylase)
MQLGKLVFDPVKDNYDLVAAPIQQSLQDTELAAFIFVAKIDPELADTAAFCKAYDVGLEISTNCLVVEAKRADRTWYAACLVLATDMADINGIVRRQLDARKISFASMDTALALTKMEYGGITPIGLPADWPILVDQAVMKNELVILGGGIRGSKLAVKTRVFNDLPNATVMKIAK